MRARRVVIAVATVLLAFACTAAVIWKLKHPTVIGADGTSVRELAACSKELPWGEPTKIESISKQREGLVIRILVNATCGGQQPVEPETKVEGQNVKISWFWYLPEDEWIAACMCTRRLEFVSPKAASVSKPEISFEEARWKE